MYRGKTNGLDNLLVIIICLIVIWFIVGQCLVYIPVARYHLSGTALKTYSEYRSSYVAIRLKNDSIVSYEIDHRSIAYVIDGQVCDFELTPLNYVVGVQCNDNDS